MDPLAQLRDIHYPEPISWWPLAPGWYVVIAIILFLVAIIALHYYRRYQRRRAWRHCLIQLATLRSAEKAHQQETVAELNVLIRRFTLSYYPREQVASLHGEAWLAFLDDKGKTDQFSQGIGRSLLTAPYQAQSDIDLTALIDLIEQWLGKQAKGVSKC